MTIGAIPGIFSAHASLSLPSRHQHAALTGAAQEVAIYKPSPSAKHRSLRYSPDCSQAVLYQFLESFIARHPDLLSEMLPITE